MATKQKQPQLGTRGWKVEWCAGVPLDEFGDAILDAGDYRREVFADREAADKRAREVYPNDFFGSVQITPVELIDPYADIHEGTMRRTRPEHYQWEVVGESEYYDGPES